MSVNTDPPTNSGSNPPLGLKVLCIGGSGLTIIGFFSVAFLAPSMLPAGASLIGILAVGLISLLNIGLLYFLYHGNRIIYQVYAALVTLNLATSLLSLDIIGVIVQGLILTYLILIRDYFAK